VKAASKVETGRKSGVFITEKRMKSNAVQTQVKSLDPAICEWQHSCETSCERNIPC